MRIFTVACFPPIINIILKYPYNIATATVIVIVRIYTQKWLKGRVGAKVWGRSTLTSRNQINP